MLVVDAEGAEGKILQGQLPEPLPRLVLFEHAHLKGAIHRIDANLRRHNFTHLADLKHNDQVGRNLPAQDRLYGRAVRPRC